MDEIKLKTVLDLAIYTHTWLKNPPSDSLSLNIPREKTKINLRFLKQLFSCAFQVSFNTEEGAPVTFEIIYLNPNEDKPRRRWKKIPFTTPLDLNERSLSKLALATDLKSSAIATYKSSAGNPILWGLIDQRDLSYKNLYFRPTQIFGEKCGVFQLTVDGPGRLSVKSDNVLIAELNATELRIGDLYNDAFREGDISDFLRIETKTLAAELLSSMNYSCEDAEMGVRYEYVACLSGLLSKIRGFQHGGSFLIQEKHSKNHLKIKHEIFYDRLNDSIRKGGREWIFATGNSLELENEDTENYELTERDADEYDSSQWFVANLTRIDGLVLLDIRLNVRGFGIMIECGAKEDKNLERNVLRATIKNGTQTLSHLDHKMLGTRHQSMMKYCYSHPSCIGLVVSQDGDVRAIKRVGDKLIVWEELKIVNLY